MTCSLMTLVGFHGRGPDVAASTVDVSLREVRVIGPSCPSIVSPEVDV